MIANLESGWGRGQEVRKAILPASGATDFSK